MAHIEDTKKEYLLSICIPTFNRAEVLDNTLEALVNNNDFDPEKIEIIVSDNCSTDNTKETVQKYPQVKYIRNIENIRDRNFTVVLEAATGKYIKLFNDTLSFKPGALGRMLKQIEENPDQSINLFFYQNNSINSDTFKNISSKSDLIEQVSFYTTWIANFGCWKSLFNRIVDKDRYASLQFLQVDWTFRLTELAPKGKVYFDDIIEVTTPQNKGGYNVFDTFVNKYLWIVKQERFNIVRYEKEKYRLCRYFVIPWMIRLQSNKKLPEYTFDTKGYMGIIVKKYWYEPYFYIFWLYFLMKR